MDFEIIKESVVVFVHFYLFGEIVQKLFGFKDQIGGPRRQRARHVQSEE